MILRTATCPCRQLSAVCSGEPIRVSVCHCLDCQRRSGSAFAVQARWPHECVELTGACRERSHVGASGRRATFRFCTDCGATIAFVAEGLPDLTAIPVGAFADPGFPPPEYSVFEGRKHAWVAVAGDGVAHYD